VRDANTGISAVIDGNGRVRNMLGLNRLGVVDSALPAQLQPTLYDRFGDLVFLLLLVTAAFASFLRTRV
jgi:apolipoprotein N-acyltransferase